MATITRWQATDGTTWDTENEAIRRNTLMYNRETWFNDAASAEGRGDYGTAVRLFTNVINSHGDYSYNTVSYARRGQANFNWKRYADAISDLNTALRGNIWNPKLSDDSKRAIQGMIAASYENSGDDDGATVAYAKASQLYPSSDDFRNNATRLQGKMDKVLSAYDGLGANESFNKGCEFDNAHKHYCAFKMYLKAAEMGHASAQNNVACCYSSGEGTPEDGYKAIEWYKKSAAQNNPNAARGMGIAYENGQGNLRRSLSKALSWYKKAKKLGNAKAEKDIANVKEKMRKEGHDTEVANGGVAIISIVDRDSGYGSTFTFGIIFACIGLGIGSVIGGWIAIGLGGIIGWVIGSQLIGKSVFVNLFDIILGIACGVFVGLLSYWVVKGLVPDMEELVWVIICGVCMIAGVALYLIARSKGNKILLVVVIALGIGGAFTLTKPKFPFSLPQGKPSAVQTAAETSATMNRNANFRSGPSTDDAIIRQLQEGATVTLTGEVSGGWTQISHNGDTGWVSTEFLNK